MNPAALKVNLADLPRGAEVIVDSNDFTRRIPAKVGWNTSPLEAYRVNSVTLTVKALKDSGLTRKDAERAKNMFALGPLSRTPTRLPTSPSPCCGIPPSTAS